MCRLLNTALPALLIVLSVPACAGNSGQPDSSPGWALEENPVPADFAVAVTVLPGSESDGEHPPVRYVVQPDSILRAAVGAGVSLDVLPRRTRRLTRAQMSAIYSHAVREGLDRGLGGEPLTRGVTPRPAADETLIVVELTAHETRRAAVYRSGDETVGAWQLVSLLGEFARVR